MAGVTQNRTLVSGANGFVGSALMTHLQAQARPPSTPELTLVPTRRPARSGPGVPITSPACSSQISSRMLPFVVALAFSSLRSKSRQSFGDERSYRGGRA